MMSRYDEIKKSLEENRESDKKSIKSEKPTYEKKEYTKEEYRANINREFLKQKDEFLIIEEAVNNLTKKGRGELLNLTEAIKYGLRPEFEKDENGRIISAKFGAGLSDEELENYVIYLPAEMMMVNHFMESKILDAEYSKYVAEKEIAIKLLEAKGGTVQERQKIAELESMFPSITAMIKKQVYQNLKMEIESANRLYESLKKVLQARMDDKKIFGKNSNYN